MPLPARGLRRPSADLCTLVKWGPAPPAPPPQVLTISDSEIGGPSATALPPPRPPCASRCFLKTCFQICMEWQTVGGVGLGREGLHERRTHAHHTSRTLGPGAGVPGQGEESSVASRTPSPPQAPVPLPVVRLEARIWGQPRPARLCSGGRQRPAISGGWRRGFCPSCPLGSGWQVGRERAEGSFWRLPKKGAKEDPLPTGGRRSGIQTHGAKCKPTGDTPTHPPRHSHAISPSSCSED